MSSLRPQNASVVRGRAAWKASGLKSRATFHELWATLRWPVVFGYLALQVKLNVSWEVCEQLLRERAEEKEKERESDTYYTELLLSLEFESLLDNFVLLLARADRARAKGSPKQSLSPAARKTDRRECWVGAHC